MTTRQIEIRAYREWQGSSDIKRAYHTFEYYWWQRYARVYGLPSRAKAVEQTIH